MLKLFGSRHSPVLRAMPYKGWFAADYWFLYAVNDLLLSPYLYPAGCLAMWLLAARHSACWLLAGYCC